MIDAAWLLEAPPADLPDAPVILRRSSSTDTAALVEAVNARQRLDRRTAHRWVRSIGKRAELGLVHPHML